MAKFGFGNFFGLTFCGSSCFSRNRMDPENCPAVLIYYLFIRIFEYMDILSRKFHHRNAEILKALGHPTRLCIVAGLLQNQCNVTKMVTCLRTRQTTVSQHLGVLKAARIIKGRRNGQEICYQVVDKTAARIVRGLGKSGSAQTSG